MGLRLCRCVYYVGHKDERAKKFATEVASLQFNVLVTTYEYIMRDRTKLSKVRTACCTSFSFSHRSICNAARAICAAPLSTGLSSASWEWAATIVRPAAHEHVIHCPTRQTSGTAA